MKYSKTVELTVGSVFEALGKYKKASYAAGELGVGVRDLKRFMRRNGIKEKESVDLWGTAVASLSTAIYDNASKFMDGAVPKSQKGKLEMASKYRATDDLVGDLVLMSTDISVKGIKVRLAGTKTRQNRIKRFEKNYDMSGLSSQMFESAYTSSSIVALVKRHGQTVKYVKILEPERCTVVRNGGVVNGQPVKGVLYELPQYVLEAVRKKQLTGLDPRWIAAAKSRVDGQKKGFIQLSEDNGEYVHILNRKGIRDALVDPEMSRSFPQIELRKIKWDGEFSVDFHIKNLIHQIIIDKSKAKSNPFKSIVQQATQKQLDKIRDIYKGDQSKALLEVTTPEVDHKFHAPEPDKITPPNRFDNVDKVIERNFGFAKVLITGEGGTYSGGYILTKQLIARVERWREVVASFWEELYSSIIPSDEGISVSFDPNVLKEAAQVLKEIEFLGKNGHLSPQTITEIFGYSNEFEVMRKREARENIDDYTPVFEPSQGIVAAERGVDTVASEPGEPGAPPSGGAQSDKEGEGEEPRPN